MQEALAAFLLLIKALALLSLALLVGWVAFSPTVSGPAFYLQGASAFTLTTTTTTTRCTTTTTATTMGICWWRRQDDGLYSSSSGSSWSSSSSNRCSGSSSRFMPYRRRQQQWPRRLLPPPLLSSSSSSEGEKEEEGVVVVVDEKPFITLVLPDGSKRVVEGAPEGQILRRWLLDNKYDLYDMWGKVSNCGGE